MTTHRGLDGFLSFGGRLVAGTGPLVNGALVATDVLMDIDGTNLDGVVVPGDTFTLAGESGSPVHTVTVATGIKVVAVDAIANIGFTPAIAAGGVANNAVVTMISNSVAEAKMHKLTIAADELDTSSFNDAFRSSVAGLVKWNGTGVAWLDYGDSVQSAFIDKLMANTPTPAINGVLFGVADKKQFYGACALTGIDLAGGDIDGIVEITFTFSGNGSLLPDWN